jgi:NADPH:quinone reductase-like Zn-dependent oxidoreductase
MRALRAHHRGGPEQLVYEQAPNPSPGDDDVLIDVEAAGITVAELGWDLTWETRSGADRTPTIPAHAVAGVVRGVGEAVTGFRPGDGVFGLVPFDRDGAAAELTVAPQSAVAHAPRSLDAAERATLPLAALTAWQALVDHARIGAGEQVVVLGGAGAVGVFAVQLAVAFGAHVVATAAPEHAAFVRDLGADEIVDLSSESLDSRVSGVDVVIDAIGGEVRDRSFRVMRPRGRLVTLGGPAPAELARNARVEATFFVVEPDQLQLRQLAHMADCGVVRPVVSETFPLELGRDAYERRGSDRPPGTTVLTVGRDARPAVPVT